MTTTKPHQNQSVTAHQSNSSRPARIQRPDEKKGAMFARGFRIIKGGAQRAAIGVLAAAMCVSGFAQSVPATTPNAEFAVTAIASEGGKVIKLPGHETFSLNAMVYLKAEPQEGFVFMGWSQDVETMRNPLSIQVTRSITVRATFARAGIGVIMDNPEADFEGTWATSTMGPRHRYEDYRYVTARPDAPTASVTFRPDLPRSGIYDVYVWHASGNNRTTNAVWNIHHKNGVAISSINQQRKGGEWVPLISGVEFDSGANHYVRLSNQTGETADGTVVVADAVAFVFIRESEFAGENSREVAVQSWRITQAGSTK